MNPTLTLTPTLALAFLSRPPLTLPWPNPKQLQKALPPLAADSPAA